MAVQASGLATPQCEGAQTPSHVPPELVQRNSGEGMPSRSQLTSGMQPRMGSKMLGGAAIADRHADDAERGDGEAAAKVIALLSPEAPVAACGAAELWGTATLGGSAVRHRVVGAAAVFADAGSAVDDDAALAIPDDGVGAIADGAWADARGGVHRFTRHRARIDARQECVGLRGRIRGTRVGGPRGIDEVGTRVGVRTATQRGEQDGKRGE